MIDEVLAVILQGVKAIGASLDVFDRKLTLCIRSADAGERGTLDGIQTAIYGMQADNDAGHRVQVFGVNECAIELQRIYPIARRETERIAR